MTEACRPLASDAVRSWEALGPPGGISVGHLLERTETLCLIRPAVRFVVIGG